MWKLILLIFLFASFQEDSNAQIIPLRYEEGKQLLLKENVLLLAEYYNLDLAEAQLQQASLWDNPLFVWNAEMYSFAQNSYFRFANQKLIQLEYSFSVSGRRIQAIRKANVQKEIAQLAISDVIRGLILEYSVAFYNLHALRAQNEILEKVQSNFLKIIEMNEKKLELGIISESDLVRLKAENLALQSEISANKNDIASAQAELHKLLNLDTENEIYPNVEDQFKGVALPLEQVQMEAKIHRPDLKLAAMNLEYFRADLRLQKAEAVPRVNLGYQPLDNGSNHVRPYSGMVFEMEIPIFNRNQGNIQAARIQIDKQQYAINYAEHTVESQVAAAYTQLANSLQILQSYNQSLFDQMNELSENANLNYEKRNISLIEFIDFQRSFIENQKNWIQAKNNYQIQLNHLSFVVGKNMFKP